MIKKVIYASIGAIVFIGANLSAQCPVATLGPDVTICLGDNDTIALAGSDPEGGSPVWSSPDIQVEIPIIGGTRDAPSPISFLPDGDAKDVSAVVNAITASLATSNVFEVYYSITKDNCPDVKDTINITVGEAPESYLLSPESGGDVLGIGISLPGNASISNCDGVTTHTLVGNSVGAGEAGIWAIEGSAAGSIAPSGSTADVSGLAIGETVLTWTVDNGTCSTESIVTINIADGPPTAADAGVDKQGCAGEELTLIGNAPSSGDPLWSLTTGAGGFPTGAPTVGLTPVAGGSSTVDASLNAEGVSTLYYIISIGAPEVGNSCTSIDSMEITVNCSVGIDENVNNGLSVSVQPNPASDIVTISLEDSEVSIAIVSIVSTDGRSVLTEELGAVSNINETLDISSLQKGVYIVKVLKGDAVYTSILVVS